MFRHTRLALTLLVGWSLGGSSAIAQSARPAVTLADYERARRLAATYTAAADGVVDSLTWLDATHLQYRVAMPGGFRYVSVDASGAAPTKRPVDSLVRRGRGPGFGGPGGIPGLGAQAPTSVASPDARRVAYINNYNVFVRDSGTAPIAGTALSTDGSEGDPYTLNSIAWSPDSKRLVAYRVRPGYRRIVRYVISSPLDQLQPSYMERDYTKPGDVLDLPRPTLFHVDTRTHTVVDAALFPNPFSLARAQWWRDGRGFTMEYNERGHQAYRIIEVDTLGRARALVDETSRTFIDYRRAAGTLTDGGRTYRYNVNDGREIIWLSERDGWAHLYLYDGTTGQVKTQITRGDWVVRAVQRVDEQRRQIYFSAGGMHAGHDPYFAHYYRINFDGTDLTRLTDAAADHQVTFSPDGALYVDSYSRVDQAPITVLRRTADASVLLELERGDLSALRRVGWRPMEPFVAKGRDGVTDIYGVVVKPTTFNPRRKYPVIEFIYAGPHGSFVPKSFTAFHNMQALAELGFIVVQIDGMGTANRSRAFHDVAWKNLGDAGFPDRIRWHQAFAAQNAWYDITRVGIFGGSAGGQNALGALLFHPEFYKVAVSFAGCHDNRMDKIWWNEQWMGWPIGPEYEASSNVANAWRLQGKLLLIVGELDTNVDPSSTLQVASALITANKTFDMLYWPGEEHGVGRRGPTQPYGDRKMWDFFVEHLYGTQPPDWNALPESQRGPGVRNTVRVGEATRPTTTTSTSIFGQSWAELAASFDPWQEP